MRKFLLLSFGIIGIFVHFTSLGQGNCLYFDGSDDYVSVANHSSLNFGTGSFTIEFWVKTSATSGTIINKKSGSSTAGYRVYLTNGTIGVQYNGNSGQKYGADNFINTNTWHHVAIVGYPTKNDDDDDVLAITVYYDGAYVTTTIHGYLSSIDNTQSLFIGKNWFTSYFAGYLEEVRLWNIARTQTQIQSNMYTQISGSASGLRAYWRFNESSGTNANDETSNNNDGTLINMSSGSWVTSTVPMPFQTTGTGNWSSTSTWLSGTIPNSQYAPVQIDHNITVDDDYTIGKLTNNATLTINSTASLVLKDQLVNSGTIKVTSNTSGNIGSFIDAGTGTFGTNIIERYFTDNKWHYFSIPISSVSSSSFSGGSVWQYDETTPGWSRVPLGTNLTVARGYDVYFANTGTKQISFNGTFNSGQKSISLTYSSGKGNGYNLVGNPYPSTIDWDASSGWTRNYVNSAIYVWNPNTNSIETYVMYGGEGTNGGSRYIPATQGFFVICSQNTTLTMNNNVRVINDDRTLRNEYNSNELRIKISGFGFSDESLIRFNPEASEMFDGKYDAYKFYSYTKEVPQIYTLDNQNIEYAIQSVPNVCGKLVIPLNVYVGIEGEYILTFDKKHLSENCNIMLEDLITHEMIDLNTTNEIRFYSSYSDQSERFLLHFYQNHQIFNNLEENQNGQNLKVYSHGRKIYLINNLATPQQARIQLFNLSGQVLIDKNFTCQGLTSIDPGLEKGIYLLSVTIDHKTVSHKITLF